MAGTTVYDGIAFLEKLRPDARRHFENKTLRFTQYFSRPAWQARFGPSEADVLRRFGFCGLKMQFGKGAVLRVEFTTPAIRRTRFQKREAFCNSVLHALDDPDFYGMSFEDGSLIHPELEDHLRKIANDIEIPLPWSEGAFAIIDNSRVMHGRESYDDDNRRFIARHQRATF